MFRLNFDIIAICKTFTRKFRNVVLEDSHGVSSPSEVHPFAFLDFLLWCIVGSDVKLTLLSTVDGDIDVIADIEAPLLQNTDVSSVAGAG